MTTGDRLAAALAERYRIERELGAGGMATVYLAQDLRHDRRVAVKVLRHELAAVIGAERFLLEIKTTANLQHPSILPLFDSGAAGQQGGEGSAFLYYVMPYVEGESLRDRLNREKQLPIGDAIRIVQEVASALDYAHRHGVIHRDIKPENILLHDGRALVADFGIALAASKAGGARMTETGMSLGTPHYMSPEQAMGEREITARSDVYALGAMTYEMLVGDPPFTGSTAQAIVARVVTETPRPMTPQRHTIPPHVEAAVRCALEKLPADRFATAAAFADAMSNPGFMPRTTVASTISADVLSRDSWRGKLIAVLAVAVILLAVLSTWALLRPVPAKSVIRYSLGLAPDQAMRHGVLGISIAISGDGKRMVYVGKGASDDQLWILDRNRLDATPLQGTSGAMNPFFSPDGSRVAFFVSGNFDLKVVPVTGGTPITLVPGSGAAIGGTWGEDGWIYFDSPVGLSRVPAAGGNPEHLIPYDSATNEIGQGWPAVLPNGKGLLYRSRSNLDPADFDIVAFDFKTRERHILTKGLIARFVEPGYMVFLRADGSVLAAPFDPDRFRLTGAAVPLFEGVMVKPFGSADIAISSSGTLAYVPELTSGKGIAELVYVSREGDITPLSPPVTFNPSDNRALSLSPDGTRVAFDIAGDTSTDIWIKQLPGGPLSRLTFDGSSSARPIWTPDGKSVLYILGSGNQLQSVWKKRADGSNAGELVLTANRPITEAFFSSDGHWLIYRVTEADGNRDIYGLRPGRDTSPTPLVTGPFVEQAAALSPDGRWLAYMSNESGQNEIFVRPFPNTNASRWQISTRGGAAPRWAHSGRELFFEGTNGDFMVVPVTPGAFFQPGTPQRLFSFGGSLFGSVLVPYYDPTPDDRRFVTVRPAAVNRAPGAGQIVMVDNWFEELRTSMQSQVQ
jgi:serine/threonine-protein kinase